MKKEYKEATNKNFNMNPKRFDKLPVELADTKKTGH